MNGLSHLCGTRQTLRSCTLRTSTRTAGYSRETWAAEILPGDLGEAIELLDHDVVSREPSVKRSAAIWSFGSREPNLGARVNEAANDHEVTERRSCRRTAEPQRLARVGSRARFAPHWRAHGLRGMPEIGRRLN